MPDTTDNENRSVIDLLNDQLNREDAGLFLAQLTATCFRPERFVKFCENWNEYAAELEQANVNDDVLERLYHYADQAVERTRSITDQKSDRIQDIRFVTNLSFATDSHLNLISISPEAEVLFDISIGDSIRSFIPEDVDLETHIVDEDGLFRKYFDIHDASRNRYLASLRRLEIKNINGDVLVFELERMKLSRSVRSYLSSSLNLTKSELNILELIVQRQNVEEIADTQSISINTVRTHINRIIKKFSARSTTEVALKTAEIISLDGKTVTEPSNYWQSVYRMPKNSIVTHLESEQAAIEFCRYGPANKRPLMILHSLEYGYTPPSEFVQLASDYGYTVYCPLRPGFGVSTPANSLQHTVNRMTEFIELLGLEDVALVSLSTSTPLGLRLHKRCKQISRLVSVNYAFNADDKLANIKPTWIRGMLDLGLRSNSSLSFGATTAKFMIQKIGTLAFYEKLYAHCDEDLAYIRGNIAQMYHAANALLSAAHTALGQDIKTAFQPDPKLESFIDPEQDIISVFGENTHHFDIEKAHRELGRLKIPLHVMEGTGRNCIYQRPDMFFRILQNQLAEEDLPKVIAF